MESLTYLGNLPKLLEPRLHSVEAAGGGATRNPPPQDVTHQTLALLPQPLIVQKFLQLSTLFLVVFTLHLHLFC